MGQDISQLGPEGSRCPLCVLQDQKVDRGGDGVCQNCSRIIMQYGLNRKTIRPAKRLDVGTARTEIYKNLGHGVIESFDTQGSDWNDLQLYIKSSTNHIIDHSVTFRGGFTAKNHALQKNIEQFLGDYFSTNIQAVEIGLDPIRHARLACAGVELLCSRFEMIEEVHTILDGKEVPNNFRRICLTARFEDILVSQLPKLIDRVLHAVRTEATITNQQYRANAHAAAAVLWYNLDFFRNHLHHGYLRNHMSKALRRLVANYFEDVVHELTKHLALGCEKYTFWTTPIKGPLTNLRRNEETYTVHLWLQQNKTTPEALTAPEPPLMVPHVIAAPNGQMSYLDSGPLFYNQATGQAGTMATLDSRYRSSNDRYSGQYTLDDETLN